MFILNPDLINSCRVCRSPNQDGDYQSLYQSSSKLEEKPVLSEVGILYENLLDISLKVRHCYPQFLCNSCELQIKLFKKLKDKAHKTLEYLKNLYVDKEHIQHVASEDYAFIETEREAGANKSKKQQEGTKQYQENECKEYQKNESYKCEESIDDFEKFAACEENIEFSDVHEIIENNMGNAAIECEASGLNVFNIDGEERLKREHLYTDEEISHSCTAQGEIEIDSLANKITFKTQPTADITLDSINSEENIRNLRIELLPVIDKNDYVTEIYELLDDESKPETYSNNNEIFLEYDVCTTENVGAFNDIEYVLEENLDNLQTDVDNQKRGLTKASKRNAVSTTRKREYKCSTCQLEFKSSQEHKLHRTQDHNETYTCYVCSKELKSISVLYHHMKIHNDQPAYQCEICGKTFIQKANYQYHMNGHNNIRNFKCNLCAKAFISKADLKVHLRLHTGERPYVCNICGKDYLMMEHLKTHLLTHTEQYFQCDICSNQFATHKTLRLHVQTIHAHEPRFKCTFCLKPFRRKHHLQYHLKLHQKNESYVDSGYEMIDDPDVVSNKMDYNPVDLGEHDTVDEPGFIALNNYNIT